MPPPPFSSSLALLPTLLRNLARGFSWSMLSRSAAFGLPKVPHGLAHQILNLSDRKLIEIFSTLAASGLYHIGYVMGTGVKFFLSAFELAWGPFVYAQLEKPDAPAILARIATYAFAALCGFGLLNAVFGRELLYLMAEPKFHAAHTVIPIVVLAYVMQGVFALTSIGIGISKKTRYFPMITVAAATLNVVLNLFWIPRFGILGAAWSTVAGYALMAGLGYWLGNRQYPIPFEGRRLGKIVLAAAMAFGISTLASRNLWAAVSFKAAACAIFPVALWAFGFFREDEDPLAQVALEGVPDRSKDLFEPDRLQAFGSRNRRALGGRLSDHVAGRAVDRGPHHPTETQRFVRPVANGIGRTEEGHVRSSHRVRKMHGTGVSGHEDVEPLDRAANAAKLQTEELRRAGGGRLEDPLDERPVAFRAGENDGGDFREPVGKSRELRRLPLLQCPPRARVDADQGSLRSIE